MATDPKRQQRVRRAEAQDEPLPQEGLQLSKDGGKDRHSLRGAPGDSLKKKGVVNAKRGQEIEIKSDSLPFGFAIQRSLVTLMRTEERGVEADGCAWMGRDEVKTVKAELTDKLIPPQPLTGFVTLGKSFILSCAMGMLIGSL